MRQFVKTINSDFSFRYFFFWYAKTLGGHEGKVYDMIEPTTRLTATNQLTKENTKLNGTLN